MGVIYLVVVTEQISQKKKERNKRTKFTDLQFKLIGFGWIFFFAQFFKFLLLHRVHREKSHKKTKQIMFPSTSSEETESLLPSTSSRPHRHDYQSIGEPIAQCLCLIIDIIYSKMHAINFNHDNNLFFFLLY